MDRGRCPYPIDDMVTCDVVELIMVTENKFGIDISDDDAMRLRTAGDLLELLGHRTASGAVGRIWTQLRRLIEFTGGPPAASVTRDTPLVESD